MGGSEIGTIYCVNSFGTPFDIFQQKRKTLLNPPKSKMGTKPVITTRYRSPKYVSKDAEHGIKNEHRTYLFACEWMFSTFISSYQKLNEDPKWRIDPSGVDGWKYHVLKNPNNYLVPYSSTHPYFNSPMDQRDFGGVLDVEGSLIDIEIKNPSPANVKRFYTDFLPPSIFAQMQWYMALRNRKFMLLFVTGIEQNEGAFLREVRVWMVKFLPSCFDNLVRKARFFMGCVYDQHVDYSVFEANFQPKSDFIKSKEYKEWMANAKKIYSYSNYS